MLQAIQMVTLYSTKKLITKDGILSQGIYIVAVNLHLGGDVEQG